MNHGVWGRAGWAGANGGMQNDFNTAADRSCDNQKNNCADLANNGGGSFEVGDCDRQNGKSLLFLSFPMSLSGLDEC